MIKRNRTWKIPNLPGYSLASRCTTDRLHVSLRTVTFCHGVLRSARFITAHYVSHFRRDCRGRFLNCQKNCHGVHGYPGVLRLPIPFPCAASRLSRFAHGCLKRGRRDRREHSVNAVLRLSTIYHDYQRVLHNVRNSIDWDLDKISAELFKACVSSLSSTISNLINTTYKHSK